MAKNGGGSQVQSSNPAGLKGEEELISIQEKFGLEQPTLQRNAVQRLLNKFQRDVGTQNFVATQKLLHQAILHPSVVVSESAITGYRFLVEKAKVITPKQGLVDLINLFPSLPSSASVHHVVQTIYEIMSYAETKRQQLSKSKAKSQQGQPTDSDLNLLQPVHPFISLYRCRPDAWSDLLFYSLRWSFEPEFRGSLPITSFFPFFAHVLLGSGGDSTTPSSSSLLPATTSPISNTKVTPFENLFHRSQLHELLSNYTKERAQKSMAVSTATIIPQQDEALSVLSFLCSCLPCHQFEDSIQSSFSLNACREVIDTLQALKGEGKKGKGGKGGKGTTTLEGEDELHALAFDLLGLLLALSLRFFERKRSLLPLLQLVKRLLGSSSLLKLPSLLELLSFFLLIVNSESEQLVLLQLFDASLRTFSVNNHSQMCILPFALFPMLRLMSSPSSSISTLSSSLVSKLELLLSTAVSSVFCSPNIEPTNLLKQGSHIVFTLLHQGRGFLANLLSRGDTITLDHPFMVWLMGLKEEISPNANSSTLTASTADSPTSQAKNDTTFFIATYVDWTVSSLYIHPLLELRSSEETLTSHRKACLDIVSGIAAQDPFRGLSFLPLLLYQLGRDPSPQVQLDTLRCVTSLARHEACVGPVLRTITPLFDVPSLVPVALRLMLQLWYNQDRMFPRLRSALQRTYPKQVKKNTTQLEVEDEEEGQMGENQEVKVAKAACIRDVCHWKPERGLDLIALLSGIFNSADSLEVSIAFGVQALHELCFHDVLDFKTAWSVVSRKLSSETRPLIVVQLCVLLANGSSEVVVPEDEFIPELLELLWGYYERSLPSISPSGSEEQLASVRREALKALSRYAKTADITATTPPASADPNAGLMLELYGTSATTKRLQSILSDPDDEVRKVAETLASAAMMNEIAQRRRIIKPEDNPNQVAHKVLQNITPFLTTIAQAPPPSLRGGTTGATLLSFNPKPTGNKADIPKNMANTYRRTLSDLVNDADTGGNDWQTRVLAIPAWMSFMKRCTDAVIEAANQQATSAERTVAVETNCDSLIQTLLTRCGDESPAVAENAVLALAGLGVALPSSTVYRLVEVIYDKLFSICRNAHSTGDGTGRSNERVVYASSVGLGCISFAVQPADFNRFADASKLLLDNIQKHESEWVRFGSAIGIGLLGAALYNTSQTLGEDFLASATTATLGGSQDERKRLLLHISQSLKKHFEETVDAKWSLVGMALGLCHISLGLENSKDTEELLSCYRTLLNRLKTIQTRSTGAGEEGDRWRATGIVCSLPTLVVRCFRAGSLRADEVENVISLLSNLTVVSFTSHLSIVGLSSLVHGLLMEGYNISSSFFSDWTTSLLETVRSISSESAERSQNVSSAHAIASALGLANLVGAEALTPPSSSQSIINQHHGQEFQPTRSLAQFLQETHSPIPFSTFLQRITEGMKSVLDPTIDTDDRVKRVMLWTLGYLAGFGLATSGAVSGQDVPHNLDHLPNTSQIRSLFNFLLSNLQQAATSSSSIERSTAVAVLGAFMKIVGVRRMPIVNWAPILQRLMKGGFGVQSQIASFRFAVEITKERDPPIHPGATVKVVGLLSGWTEPPFFLSMTKELQIEILEHLYHLCNVFPSVRGRRFLLETLEIAFFSSSSSSSSIQHRLAFIQGLNKAVATFNPTIHGSLALHDVALSIFDLIGPPITVINKSSSSGSSINVPGNAITVQKNSDSISILRALIDSFKTLPMEMLEAKLSLRGVVSPKLEKNVYMRSLLVSEAKLPLKLITVARSWCFSEVHHPNTRSLALALMEPIVAPLAASASSASTSTGTPVDVQLITEREKKKWLVDSFDSLMLCSEVGLGLHFLGLLTLSWSTECHQFFYYFPSASHSSHFEESTAPHSPLPLETTLAVSLPASLFPVTLTKVLTSWQSPKTSSTSSSSSLQQPSRTPSGRLSTPTLGGPGAMTGGDERELASVVFDRCLSLLSNPSSPPTPPVAFVLLRVLLELKNRQLILTDRNIPLELFKRFG